MGVSSALAPLLVTGFSVGQACRELGRGGPECVSKSGISTITSALALHLGIQAVVCRVDCCMQGVSEMCRTLRHLHLTAFLQAANDRKLQLLLLPACTTEWNSFADLA